MHKIDAFLALGSNIGPKASTIKKALILLSNELSIKLIKVSKFYETTPVSNVSQENFINAVCQIQTTLDPLTLFNQIECIEKILGKEKKPKNHPRKIDIDLLFFSDQEYNFENLTIPHPKWKKRLFVLIPLFDLKKEITLMINHAKHVFDIEKILKNFANDNSEKIKVYEDS